MKVAKDMHSLVTKSHPLSIPAHEYMHGEFREILLKRVVAWQCEQLASDHIEISIVLVGADKEMSFQGAEADFVLRLLEGASLKFKG